MALLVMRVSRVSNNIFNKCCIVLSALIMFFIRKAFCGNSLLHAPVGRSVSG